MVYVKKEEKETKKKTTKNDVINDRKGLFGGINLTWPRIIIAAIIIGLYCGFIALIPATLNTSFRDIDISFEVWILFGIIIIMNSKSSKDSALKCFIFFLISQPLIYIVQYVVNHYNLLMSYYRFWVLPTIACIPMGFIGYYMKKDKWWGLLILVPMMIFLGMHYGGFLKELVFLFPHHLLTTIFCIVTIIIYPLCIFKDQKIRKIGVIAGIIIILFFTIIAIFNPKTYEIDYMGGDNYEVQETDKVYLKDVRFGKAEIKYMDGIDCYASHMTFVRGGKTEFVIVSKDGQKREYVIVVETNKYDIEEKK